MRTKKRIEITVETDQVLIIRRRGGAIGGWCATCAAPVRMVTPEEAVAVAGVGLRTIYRWVDECQLHITETAGGLFWICLNSLPKYRAFGSSTRSPSKYLLRDSTAIGGFSRNRDYPEFPTVFSGFSEIIRLVETQ